MESKAAAKYRKEGNEAKAKEHEGYAAAAKNASGWHAS